MPFGLATRERQEALSRRAWQCSIVWIHTRFGEGGGLLDCRRARGRLNPCARKSMEWTRKFLRQKLMSYHGHFSSYEGHKERRTNKIRGCTGLRTAGCWLARRLHQLKATITMDLGISTYFYFCKTCDLEKLGHVDQTWLEHNLSAQLPRTLVVERRQPSESIEAAFDIEYEGLMNRSDIGRCQCLPSRITFCRDLDSCCWSEKRVVTTM